MPSAPVRHRQTRIGRQQLVVDLDRVGEPAGRLLSTPDPQELAAQLRRGFQVVGMQLEGADVVADGLVVLAEAGVETTYRDR